MGDQSVVMGGLLASFREMTRPTLLFSLLTLTAGAAGKDPNTDGAGGDRLPEIGELVASDSIPGMTIPEGVGGLLSMRELRDLVAGLSERRESKK